MLSNCGRSLLRVKYSMTFAIAKVSDIGLRSFSVQPGGDTLLIRKTMGDFRRDGINPSLKDWLLISQIRSATSREKSFKSRLVMLPEPAALNKWIYDNKK